MVDLIVLAAGIAAAIVCAYLAGREHGRREQYVKDFEEFLERMDEEESDGR